MNKIQIIFISIFLVPIYQKGTPLFSQTHYLYDDVDLLIFRLQNSHQIVNVVIRISVSVWNIIIREKIFILVLYPKYPVLSLD